MSGSGTESTPFPSACISTPHYLASLAGLDVLRAGGNAIDAAVAANLALGVVAPYRCGFGGDLVAMSWDGASTHGYLGVGAAGSRADLDRVAGAVGGARMPVDGPLTVTVPGAVQGWFDVVDRLGTMSFARVAERAHQLADEGFVVSEHGTNIVADGAFRFADRPELLAVYGGVIAGGVLRQPALARTIATLVADGPDPFYRGPIAADLVDHLDRRGGLLTIEDLDRHRGRWVEPVRGRFHHLDVAAMPPPSQGVAGLLALAIAERLPLSSHGTPLRHHLLIETIKRALADRDGLADDPDAATAHVEAILDPAWIEGRAAEIDPDRASSTRTVAPAGGGTACILVADGRGGVACLVQSNLAGFGSGETVAPWGLNLHNRGSAFVLDPRSPRALGPGRLPLHTLVPTLVFENGAPTMALAASGGDGQIQTQLSVLSSVVADGIDPAVALADPRWLVDPATGAVAHEDTLSASIVDGLAERGHALRPAPYGQIRFGCGHSVRVRDDGVDGAYDPRCEGAVVGL
ncbi:MAG: gamma-glutamyltransferase family protein [Acidimicrobiales bacterium]